MYTLLSLAYLVNWGWLRIGPPYVYININPVIAQIGPLALRWYGLMYVVAILIGLWAIRGYTQRKGISQSVVDRVVWWCIAAGVIGGRLYFVVQQPDLVSGYLLQPWRILATWEGGMAFFGAIFLVLATLFWRARVERVNPLVLMDAAVLLERLGKSLGVLATLSTVTLSATRVHCRGQPCIKIRKAGLASILQPAMYLCNPQPRMNC